MSFRSVNVHLLSIMTVCLVMLCVPVISIADSAEIAPLPTPTLLPPSLNAANEDSAPEVHNAAPVSQPDVSLLPEPLVLPEPALNPAPEQAPAALVYETAEVREISPSPSPSSEASPEPEEIGEPDVFTGTGLPPEEGMSILQPDTNGETPEDKPDDMIETSPELAIADDAAEPVCDIPGCPHIGLDENHQIIALCPLGQWQMKIADEESEAYSVMSSDERNNLPPIRLTLKDGMNILYRCGRYTLSGGNSGTMVYVRAGMRGSIFLHSANILTLSVQNGAAVTISYDGHNEISTIAANGAAITLNGKGSLFVRNLNCPELTVLGGSVELPAYVRSLNGYLHYAFSAPQAECATLDGKKLTFTMPSPDGFAHLWLPVPQENCYYGARVEEDQLILSTARP